MPTTAPAADIGIAARYPGDKNIASDPEVLFADDFESYAVASDMAKRWSKVDWVRYMSISTTQHFAGNKSVEMALPITTSETGMSLEKLFSPGLNTLYFRTYCKWDAGYNVNTSNHNGILMGGGQSPGAGTVPNGTDFFVMLVQNNDIRGEGPPGWLHEYAYWPKQSGGYGDHWYPDGYGFPWKTNPAAYPGFVPRPNFLPQRDRWYCYEQNAETQYARQQQWRS